MALRRVYFSLDYEFERNLHRVRRFYELPGIVSRSAGGFQSSAVWRQAKSEGDAAVRGLINDALRNTSVSVFCISLRAAFSKYLGHEIERSLEQGNGLLGITISRIPDEQGLVEPHAPVPPEIEAAGFNVYPFTSRDQLVSQIDEAAELAKLDRVERLDRKLERNEMKAGKEKRRERRENIIDGLVEFVEIEGEIYPIKNWNVHGFLAMFYAGGLQKGDLVEIFFSVPLAEGRLEFKCQATVRWVNRVGHEIGASFVGMDDDSRVTIKRHFGASRVTD